MKSLALISVCAGVLAFGTAASAQRGQPAEPDPPSDSPQTTMAPSAAEREARLDRLFDRLAGAGNAEDAKRYESSIEALWRQSGSDTADLLTSRALELAGADDTDGALGMLAAALDVKPDYAEGWNKRATLFFLRGDYGHSMRDIRETLRFEPRHYGAWAGLGRILEQSGDETRALDAYRRALAIHPNLDGLRDQVRRLADKLRGQEL